MRHPSLDELLGACAQASVGNLSVRVRVPEDADESHPLTTLANALNILLGDLEHREEKLLQSAAALSEREAQLRMMAETLEAVLWITDAKTRRMVYANPEFERVWGMSAEEAAARPSGWLARVHPDDAARVKRALEAFPSKEDRFDMEYRIVRPHGGTRWIHARALAVRNAAGEAVRTVGVGFDVTQRRSEEERGAAMRAQLAASEKLSALGSLVSGVAHEIRTPLAYLSNNLELLRLRVARAVNEDGDARGAFKESEGHVVEALGAVKRIDALVEDMRRFTKLRPASRVEVSLDRPVAEALRLFRATHRGRISVAEDLRPTGTVLVDEGQVQQVVLNLLQNGAEAMGDRGVLAVETRDEDGAPLLRVRDEGPGIPPEHHERLFEPLFTTKEEGSGLGLAIVRRIVDDHGAALAFETGERKGTTFTVRFPAVDGKSGPRS